VTRGIYEAAGKKFMSSLLCIPEDRKEYTPAIWVYLAISDANFAQHPCNYKEVHFRMTKSN